MKYFELFAGVGGFGLGIQKIWNQKNAQNAVKKENFINIEMPANVASGYMKKNGGRITQKKVDILEETITQFGGKKFSICTEENAPVVVKHKKNFSHLNTLNKTGIKTEKNTEQDICTNLHSKKIIKKNTKSFAITATMREEDMESAPICVGFSEIDKYASQVLRYRYPKIKNYGDITKINWSSVPDFDLLTGGSPCQDFSIAGKRAGIEGARSGLVWEYIRCLKEKKPKYFIWENVKGVMSSRGGWDFGNILTAFSESGYSLWWQVLNAKDFGVPQNRERVFVVGFRDGSPPEVFFERGTNGKDIHNLEKGANQAGRRYDADGISPTIPTAGGGRHIPMITMLGGLQAHQTPRSDGISPTLNSAMGMGGGQTPLIIQERERVKLCAVIQDIKKEKEK